MNNDQKEMWNVLLEPDPITDEFGNKIWLNKDGKHHRDNDKPAVMWVDGTAFWYKNGKLHRDNDKPAVIHTDGTKWWYKDGIKYELA